MKELVEKIWSNDAFHQASQRVQLARLRREFGAEGDKLEISDAIKLMRAAAILACSENQEHRKAAFRTATSTFELFGSTTLPLDQALRTVLARLGNFPSFLTSNDVDTSGGLLPLALAMEEAASAREREVVFNKETIYLTDFQAKLWKNLIEKRRIALAAPTSAGKSFIIQNYLYSIFENSPVTSIIYIVPTRALIAQVAEDLAVQFSEFSGQKPDIVTVPIDADSPLPTRAVYVMTQERVQLTFNAHPDFTADIVVVDEAHSISEGSRGVLLQWVIDDIMARNPAAQILFASPSIRNLEIFGRLFGLSDLVEFSSVEPTVAQNFLIVVVQSPTKGRISIRTVGGGDEVPNEVTSVSLNRTIAGRVDKLVHVSAALGSGQSNIIYADGAADAEKIAIKLADLLSDREPTDAQIALAELAREAVHPNYVFIECVKRGVAFHYSNVPTQLRKAIEDAVDSGEVDYLVCTSTLLQGVNLPVKNIFMCKPHKGKGRPLESIDFWNLSGRAGRLLREFQGNIFLIDYNHWKKRPLEGPKDAVITPAIESSVRNHSEQLVSVIRDEIIDKVDNEAALETAFVRLFSDFKQGQLKSTFDRLGLEEDAEPFVTLASALNVAEEKVTIPAEILRRTPNISAHKQQRLFNSLQNVVSEGLSRAESLIPSHPRESEAFQSYADILELCHEHILGLDTSRNLHRFHAIISLKWMLGQPLPQIIEEQIERNPNTIRRTTIRNTLDLIETQIRFQAVRLFGCYNALLVYALDSAGFVELASSIPSIPTYLEVGASDKTMISFISLGLSRVTAMKLNDMSARKDLDVSQALQWLRGRPIETLDLSPLLSKEVRVILDAN